MFISLTVRLPHASLREFSIVDEALKLKQLTTTCFVQPGPDGYVKTTWKKFDSIPNNEIAQLMAYPGVARIEIICSKG